MYKLFTVTIHIPSYSVYKYILEAEDKSLHDPNTYSVSKQLTKIRDSIPKFPPEMQSFKPSFSCFDFDPNMELTNHFPELNPTLNSQSFMDFHIDNYFMQNPPQFPGNEFAGYLGENFPCIFHHEAKNVLPVSEPIASEGNEFHESNKRKAIYFTESSSGNSCPPVSEDEIRRKNVTTLFLVCAFWFFLFLLMQGVQGSLRASRTNPCKPSCNIFTRLRVGCG